MCVILLVRCIIDHALLKRHLHSHQLRQFCGIGIHRRLHSGPDLFTVEAAEARSTNQGGPPKLGLIVVLVTLYNLSLFYHPIVDNLIML